MYGWRDQAEWSAFSARCVVGIWLTCLEWRVLDLVLGRVLVDERVDPVRVREGVVDGDERLPLVREGVLREDRLDRALRLAGAAAKTRPSTPMALIARPGDVETAPAGPLVGPQSMHSSGSMMRMRSNSWMQSTGQTSTQERSLMSMQGSAMMYVIPELLPHWGPASDSPRFRASS
jgi:hypothetical protein